MRRFTRYPIYMFLLISLIFINIGCSSKPQETGTPALTISQEQVASWVRNFNPLIPGGTSRWPTGAGIYEPLFIFNSIKGKYIPWLATGYEWSNGNLILDINIRENVLWSDGSLFSAQDVVYTFQIKKEYSSLDSRGIWKYIKSVEAMNDHLVRFVFSRIYVPGLDAISGQPIIAKNIWENIEDPVRFSNPDPVGTGPFTEIVRFDHQIWELGANPFYWQKGKPAVKKLRFPAFPTNEQATIALINGEIDWGGNFIPAIDRVYVSKDPEHHHYWFPRTGGTIFFYTNTAKAPFNEVNIRKAVSLAINRDLIIKVAMYDYTIPAHPTALADGLASWRSKSATEKGYWVAHDMERSNRILDEAGYSRGEDGFRRLTDGTVMSFVISIVSGWSDWIRAAQVISQNLETVGIKARVKTNDFAAWFSRVQKGEFDMTIAWTEKGPTPFPLYRGLLSSEYLKPVGEIAEANWHRFSIPEADSLCRAFERTSNEIEIRAIVTRLEELFVEYAPAIPLFAEPSWGQYNTKRFTNFPNENNPYGQLSPNYPPENLLVMVNVVPR